MFQSTMPMERKKEICQQIIDAMKAGKKNLATKLAMQIPLPLPLANVAKQDMGVERMLKLGCNLDDAVAAYGKEWLET